MKIAVCDLEGDCFPLVWWLVQEGHQVRYWLGESDELVQRIGTGMVTKVDDLDVLLAWRPDVLLSYQTPRAYAKALRAGLPVVGSSGASIELEKNRLMAADLAARAGLTVPQTERFNSLAAARKFLNETKIERWVSKAEGGADASTSTTHPADSKEHLLQLLDYEAGRGNTSFILQERIDGVEVSTEGWFDYRHGWLRPINSTLERKRMHDGDLGPMCGCAGSIVWYWPEEEPLLWTQVLEPLTPLLKSIRYVGPFDVNSIIDYETRTPHFLEFTPRLGWSAFNALLAGVSMNVGDYLVALGAGDAPAMTFRHPFMGSVRVSIPAAENVPVMAPYRAVRHLQPTALWLDRGTLRTTGAGEESGFISIFEATDADASVERVVRNIYEREIPRILAPDVTYRKDIGDQAVNDLMLLEMWGYQVTPPETLRVEAATRPPAEAPTRLARSA